MLTLYRPRRRLLKFALAALGCGVLAAGAWAQAQAPNPLRVGVRGGTDEIIWEVVAQEARKAGLNVEVVVITAAASPNEALNNGDLAANSFQHVPFFKDQVKQRGYKLAIAGNTYISPVAFYTQKGYKSLGELKPGAKVGIPNDPSNETRALVVLRDAGLITLRDGFDPFEGTVSLNDVKSNPSQIELVEVANAVLARSLGDLDVAAIVNSYAYQAGLIATRDGIAVEKKENNPYVNILVVREQDKDAPWVKDLLKAYQSEAVREFIAGKFEGSVLPAF
jgi:D-methionine transport system substrate-binding protein